MSSVHPRLREVGFVAWTYYWLDLYGPPTDGVRRPANSKVLASWAVFAALTAELFWGFYLTRTRCVTVEGVTTCHDPIGITWPYVALVIGTLAFTLGKDVFKAFLKVRLPGSQEAEAT